MRFNTRLSSCTLTGFKRYSLHADGDRFLGVGKNRRAPENDDDVHPRHRGAERTAKLQPVHERHTDIGDEDIWLDILQHRQRHFAVGCLADERAIRFRPQGKLLRMPSRTTISSSARNTLYIAVPPKGYAQANRRSIFVAINLQALLLAVIKLDAPVDVDEAEERPLHWVGGLRCQAFAHQLQPLGESCPRHCR